MLSTWNAFESNTAFISGNKLSIFLQLISSSQHINMHNKNVRLWGRAILWKDSLKWVNIS